jgi:teichuronic acid biosynthesis glycosyltransferase TuaC
MRLLFISNVYPNPLNLSKGAFNRYLVEALARDHDVSVVAPISWIEELRAGNRARSELKENRSAVIDRFRVSFPRYFYPPKVFRSSYGWFYWRSVRSSVRGWMRSHQPSAVIGFWAHPDGEAAVRAAREVGVPSVVIVGGSDVLLLTKDRTRRRCVCKVLNSCDLVLAVSCDLKERILALGVRPERVHVWKRGIDAGLFAPGDRQEAQRRLGIPRSLRSILWVGGMVPVKGLDILLESCSLMRSRGVDYRLYLVGDGPLRTVLMSEAKARGLADHLKFVGTKLHDELPDWYRAAALTVLPSRSEGLPNVLRESLACGTPFVASDVGGIGEIADPGASILVPPGNAHRLADAITHGLERWSDRTAPIAARFESWENSASALVDMLTPLVTGPR